MDVSVIVYIAIVLILFLFGKVIAGGILKIVKLMGKSLVRSSGADYCKCYRAKFWDCIRSKHSDKCNYRAFGNSWCDMHDYSKDDDIKS